MWNAYLRPRVEQPGKYRKIADRVHKLKVSQYFDVRGVGTDERAATDSVRACTRLHGWIRSRYVGGRMGVCASRKSVTGLACGFKERSGRLTE